MTTRTGAWIIPFALLAVSACSTSPDSSGIPRTTGDEVPDASIDASIDAPLDASPAPTPDAPADAPPAADPLVPNKAVLDLGLTRVSFLEVAEVDFTNRGTSDLALGDVAVSAPFMILVNGCPTQLAAGSSCFVLVEVTPTAIGPITGTLTLPSSANTVSVPLHATGGYVVDVRVDATGASVSSDPPGIADPFHNGIFEGVFPTAVTLTAIPPPGGSFFGWDPACGDGGPTCVVPVPGPGESTVLSITARFTPPPPVGPKVTVNFTGGSTGEVRMFDGTDSSLITKCTTSPCVGVVPAGHSVVMFGFASSQFGGWSGDCVSTTSECDLGVVTSDRTVDVAFNRDPGELVSFVSDDIPHWVAFAPDGGLYVSYLDVRKLRIDGTIEWRFPLVGVQDLTSDAAGNVYGASGGEVFSLSPTGEMRWRKAIDVAPTFQRSIQSNVQVSGDGTIVGVHTSDGARVLDGDGNDRFAITGLTGIDGFAIGADGTLALGVPAAAVNRRDVRRWTRDGAPLPTIPSLPNAFDVSLAFDAGGALCGLTVGGGVQTVSRTRPDRTLVFKNSALTGFSSQDPFSGIGVNHDGALVVVRSTDANGQGSGKHVDAFTPTGSKIFSFERRATANLELLVQMESFAVDPRSRRVAMVGRFGSIYGWIEVLELPAVP